MKLEQELDGIKDELDLINRTKIETETRLKALEKEKDSLLKECKHLNIDPKHIDQIITEHEQTIKVELNLLKEQLKQLDVFRNQITI